MQRRGEGWDADVVVVGSGFGGAVAALRLTEAGHRVVVLEKGRRLTEDDPLRARKDPRAYLWQPGAGLRGFFWQRIFRHVAIIGGTGVGGGSIVWAGVLLEPGDDFYESPALRAAGIDRQELAPHLARAARMLGRVTSPHHGQMDDYLRAAARAVGAGESFGPVPTAIHFGRPGVTEPDPFFDGDGPDRTGCRLCGECLLGCPYGAKNVLVQDIPEACLKTSRSDVASHPGVSAGLRRCRSWSWRTAQPWHNADQSSGGTSIRPTATTAVHVAVIGAAAEIAVTQHLTRLLRR